MTGRLSGVPHLKDFYYDALDRGQWGLVPVAQLDSHQRADLCDLRSAGAAAAPVSRRDGMVSSTSFSTGARAASSARDPMMDSVHAIRKFPAPPFRERLPTCG